MNLIGKQVKVFSKKLGEKNLLEREGKICSISENHLLLDEGAERMGNIPITGCTEGIYEITDLEGISLLKNELVLIEYLQASESTLKKSEDEQIRIKGVWKNLLEKI